MKVLNNVHLYRKPNGALRARESSPYGVCVLQASEAEVTEYLTSRGARLIGSRAQELESDTSDYDFMVRDDIDLGVINDVTFTDADYSEYNEYMTSCKMQKMMKFGVVSGLSTDEFSVPAARFSIMWLDAENYAIQLAENIEYESWLSTLSNEEFAELRDMKKKFLEAGLSGSWFFRTILNLLRAKGNTLLYGTYLLQMTRDCLSFESYYTDTDNGWGRRSYHSTPKNYQHLADKVHMFICK